MPLDRTANRLRYLVLGIQAEGERRLNLALQQAGSDLTATQSEVIEVLVHQGPMSQTELGTQLVCTKGNVSRLLDRMQAKGLLRRDPDPASRRRVVISLTGAGAAAYRAAEPVLEALLTTIRDLYQEAEADQLTALLQRLADAFEIELARHVRVGPDSSDPSGGERTIGARKTGTSRTDGRTTGDQGTDERSTDERTT
jgi:DNA-binding MarR family transcriptional regulator